MNFARLNHVLVPQSADARQVWLKSKRWRWLGASFRLYLALTPLGRSFLVFWLFAGAFGLNVANNVCYVLWALVTGLIVSSLLARKWYAMKDVEVHVTVPKRIQAGATMNIKVDVRSHGNAYGSIRIQPPFLTWDGKYINSEGCIPYLAAKSVQTVGVTAQFSARGAHSLMPVIALRTVALGIAAGPPVMSRNVDFIVVPVFPQIAHIDLIARLKCQPQGVPLASNMGETSELVGVRPYVPGDRVRDLHMSTWARTGVPHVKQYQQEYFLRVGLVLDIHMSHFNETTFEAAISLAAGMLSYFAKQDALVDVLCIGNEFYDLTLGRSLGFLEQGLDLLATVNPSSPLDVAPVEERLKPHMEGLSALIVISLKNEIPIQQVCSWSEHCGVPTRTYHVVSESRLDVSQGTVAVSVGQIQSAKELKL